MHLITERLLERLAGDADPGETAHLAGCDRCRAELERLAALHDALNELPEVGPRRDLWPAIDEELERRRLGRRWWLSLAAAMVIAVAAGALVHVLAIRSEAPANAVRSAESGNAVRELISASRQLEGLLDRPSLSSRVMGPRQAAMIVTLEDRIAEIDAALETAAENDTEAGRVVLWSERVRLLAALIQARGAPATSPGIQSTILARARDL